VLAFRVRYLLGRVAAADVSRGSEKDRGEWPPHPDRLFCALVQAWGDLGRRDSEREFLERLERAGSPHVHATRAAADVARVSFVPVPDNWKPYFRDPNTKKDKPFPVMGAMRIGRDRKERRFVSQAVNLDVHEPHATIGWPRPREHQEWQERDYGAAATLSRLVSYLGHSSSVVAVDVVREVPVSAWIPDDNDGALLLRVPHEDRLKILEAAFEADRRPPVSTWQSYGERRVDSPGPRSHWPSMVVFRIAGGPHRLPLVASLQATRALREHLKDIFRKPPFNEEPPEVVSGRTPKVSGQSVAQSPHLAFVPLPDVDHEHAAGHLLGLALLLPASLKGDERRRVLAAIARLEDLELPAIGRWRLERQTLETPLHGLLPATWIGPSRSWATVVPMAFDRDPGDVLGGDAEAGVRVACTRLGLPSPAEVALWATPFILGVAHAREFPLFRPTVTAPRRRHVHVRLEFDAPIHGPLAIGAGRYLGYGLCRPFRGGAT
jgi:CRISPR-associated protein Csb2